MKKDFKFFLIGSVFGIFEVMVLFNSDQSTKTLLQKFLAIISFPFSVFDPIDKATDFTCSIFSLSFCRRLGFDGGPDDWVQFLILTFLVIILIIFFMV
jgi:hypothetical protein